MIKVQIALVLAALMIGNGMAQTANMISESAAQGVFFTLLGLSAIVVTRGSRSCAPCTTIRTGGRS